MKHLQKIGLLLMCGIGLFGCAKGPGIVGEYVQSEIERRMEVAKTFGAHHENRMRFFLEDNPSRITGGTVFLGDSITEQFPIEQAFHGGNVINRGIGGNTVPAVLSRVDTSVRDLAPKRLYLMIGINDLTWGKTKPDMLAVQYDELLTSITNAAPNAEIIAFSTLPAAGIHAVHNPKVVEFNEHIRSIARRYGAKYINLWPAMADEKGHLRQEFTPDGIHLNMAGNLAWLEQIIGDEGEYLNAVRALAPEWNKTYARSWPITATNPAETPAIPGGRGVDEIIIYTPDYPRPTTGTNEWGYEVAVVDGIVTEHFARNALVPDDGYIISGHGKAGAWIKSNMPVGVSISIRNGEVAVESAQASNPWIEFWHIVTSMERRDPSNWTKAKEILVQLRLARKLDASAKRLKYAGLLDEMNELKSELAN